jgi:hypothetical protein
VIVSALALAFLHDTFFIATDRTTLVVIPVLILVYDARQFGWKGFFGTVAAGFAIAAALWATSPYSRHAATSVISQTEKFEYENRTTSTGQRMRWQLGSLARASRRYTEHCRFAVQLLVVRFHGGFTSWVSAWPSEWFFGSLMQEKMFEHNSR